MRKKLKITMGAGAGAAALIGLAACNSPGTASAGKASAETTQPSAKPAITRSASPAAPHETASQQQAIIAANGYLSSGTGFSQAGLMEQLTSKAGNGFSQADAGFAIAHVKVDWNQQAVIAAKGYLTSGMGFSHDSLVQQLSSPSGNQFTQAQAEYGAHAAGL